MSPEFILEPTCGKGNFIISSLKHFQNINRITGIEIYEPYIWETKFRILKHFIENPEQNIPKIELIHANIFEFPFEFPHHQHHKTKAAHQPGILR